MPDYTAYEDEPRSCQPEINDGVPHVGQPNFSSLSEQNTQNFRDVRTVQPTPVTQSQTQLAQRNQQYVTPAQENYQIAEFTVPVDPDHATQQMVVTHPQMMKPPVHVPNEMSCSVLVALFCCLYLGIPAIIYSAQANSLRHIDPERALAKARVARTLNIISLILGAIASLFSAIYIGVYIHRLRTQYEPV